MPDYLHECLDRHGQVTLALYGQRQKLREVEQRAAGIRESGRLTYADVETITHAGLWRGGTFWQWPTEEEFKERCEDGAVEGLFTLPKRQNAVVDRMLRIFRHIEPVSVVMRFVDPVHFGILSAPVEKLLELGPAHRPQARYLKYVKDLRALRDARGFKTAADVDMALWVLGEVIDAEHSRSEWIGQAVPGYENWIHEFWNDRRLREIRVRNLTESLFGTMTMPQFAEALLPKTVERPNRDQVLLAGRVASIEFEQAVMQVARSLSSEHEDDGPDARTLMRVVRTLGISRETRDRWIQAVKTRNDAVHARPLKREDVDQLLDAMRCATRSIERVS